MKIYITTTGSQQAAFISESENPHGGAWDTFMKLEQSNWATVKTIPYDITSAGELYELVWHCKSVVGSNLLSDNMLIAKTAAHIDELFNAQEIDALPDLPFTLIEEFQRSTPQEVMVLEPGSTDVVFWGVTPNDGSKNLFITMDEGVAYEVRKSNESNCYNENGERVIEAIGFIQETEESDATVIRFHKSLPELHHWLTAYYEAGWRVFDDVTKHLVAPVQTITEPKEEEVVKPVDYTLYIVMPIEPGNSRYITDSKEYAKDVKHGKYGVIPTSLHGIPVADARLFIEAAAGKPCTLLTITCEAMSNISDIVTELVKSGKNIYHDCADIEYSYAISTGIIASR